MSGRRYEIFLAGPMPEPGPLAAGWDAPIAPEEMLKRLVLALKGAGYSVTSSAYEILATPEPRAVADRLFDALDRKLAERSHLGSTTEAEPQPQKGEDHEQPNER